MDDAPQDVRYAYAQLGLAQGATSAQIETLVRNAKSYRYRTKARIAQVERFARYFVARAEFGALDQPFADIRRAYHRMALALHPDHNRGNPAAEEQLKAINAQFERVEKINREARAYYKLPEAERQEQEAQARQSRKDEGSLEPQPVPEPAPENVAQTKPQPKAKGGAVPAQRTYMAAAVPRAMRQSRLGYLPLNCVLGSQSSKGPNGDNRIFDIIMLPAKEFMRMKSYIGLQHLMAPELKMGSFQPGFVLRNVKSVTVPQGEDAPEDYARARLMEQFGVKLKE